MTTYPLKQLTKEAARLKAATRKSVRSQGFEPAFEPGFELRIHEDIVALTIWWIQDGIRQCANMAL